MPDHNITLPARLLLGALLLSSLVFSQPANKPTTLTQVPAASSTGLRTAPVAYTIPAGGLKVNYVRSWDAKIAVPDAATFTSTLAASDGYTKITETTLYVDGL